MDRFRELTTGHVVVMGRATLESIGYPLPNRINVLLSRIAPLGARTMAGRPLQVFNRFEDVLEWAEDCGGNRMVWVIGGAEVYETTMARWHRLELTVLDTLPGFRRKDDRVMPAFWPLVASSRSAGRFGAVGSEPGGSFVTYTMRSRQ